MPVLLSHSHTLFSHRCCSSAWGFHYERISRYRYQRHFVLSCKVQQLSSLMGTQYWKGPIKIIYLQAMTGPLWIALVYKNEHLRLVSRRVSALTAKLWNKGLKWSQKPDGFCKELRFWPFFYSPGNSVHPLSSKSNVLVAEAVAVLVPYFVSDQP